MTRAWWIDILRQPTHLRRERAAGLATHTLRLRENERLRKRRSQDRWESVEHRGGRIRADSHTTPNFLWDWEDSNHGLPDPLPHKRPTYSGDIVRTTSSWSVWMDTHCSMVASSGGGEGGD